MVEEFDGKEVIRRSVRDLRQGMEAGTSYQTYVNVDSLSDRMGRVSIPGQVIPRMLADRTRFQIDAVIHLVS